MPKTFEQIMNFTPEEWEDLEGATDAEYWGTAGVLFDEFIAHMRENFAVYSKLWNYLRVLHDNIDISAIYDAIGDIEYKLSGRDYPITLEDFEEEVSEARAFLMRNSLD